MLLTDLTYQGGGTVYTWSGPIYPNPHSYETDEDYYDAVDAYYRWYREKEEAEIDIADREYKEYEVNCDD